jgi:hypothetical protein
MISGSDTRRDFSVRRNHVLRGRYEFCSIRLVILFISSADSHLGTANRHNRHNKTAGAVLLQRALGVLAGTAPLADVTLTGTARRVAGSDDETGTAVLKALATGEARMDFSFPSGQRSEVYANSDQGPVGSWSGPDGTPGAMSLHNLLVDPAWFAPALILSKLSSTQNVTVSFSGSETRDGLAVQHLTVSKQFPGLPARVSAELQRLSQMEVYLDASTSLPVSVSFNTHPDNNARSDFPVVIVFSAYQSVEGVQVPFHIQKYMDGALVLDFQLQKVDLNAGLSLGSFGIPTTVSAPAIRNWRQ